jgi:hypothetical protein
MKVSQLKQSLNVDKYKIKGLNAKTKRASQSLKSGRWENKKVNPVKSVNDLLNKGTIVVDSSDEVFYVTNETGNNILGDAFGLFMGTSDPITRSLSKPANPGKYSVRPVGNIWG